jgi:GTP-binding protein EngB required for normal cell division
LDCIALDCIALHWIDRFFLTKNSYYIVVFNIANPDLPRVDYWMRVLTNLSTVGDTPSPIILVGTHLDKCTNEAEVLDMIKRRYHFHYRCPGLKHITAVSCATGRGIPQLKEKLMELVKQDRVCLYHSHSHSHSRYFVVGQYH